MERDDHKLEIIKKLLQNNEESYRPGAWEAFSAQEQQVRKKKVTVWPKLIGAAAAIILIISAFLIAINQQQTKVLKPTLLGKSIAPQFPVKTLEKTIAITQEEKQKKLVQLVLQQFRKATLHQSVKQQIVAVDTVTNQQQMSTATIEVPAGEKTVTETDIATKSTAITSTSQTTHTHETDIAAAKPSRLPALNQFKSSSGIYKNVQKTYQSHNIERWTAGIAVSGGMQHSKKTNIGFTATVDYALNKKLSITSGLSYQQIAGSRQNAANNAISSSINGKSLESVDLRLSGIDLPIGITYHLTSKTYASVGISAFSILKKSGELNYLTAIATEKSFFDATGQLQYEYVVSQQRSSEPIEGPKEEKSNYLGFYNLSVGYQQKILGNQRINLAPYLKIPMKSNAKDQVNLVSAGLNIGITF